MSEKPPVTRSSRRLRPRVSPEDRQMNPLLGNKREAQTQIVQKALIETEHTGARSVEDNIMDESEESENDLKEAVEDEKAKPTNKEKKDKLILDEARIQDMKILFDYDEAVLRTIMEQQQKDIQNAEQKGQDENILFGANQDIKVQAAADQQPKVKLEVQSDEVEVVDVQ